MQNIKNFQLVTPSDEILQEYKNPEGQIPLFLQSEDGQDWYKCQRLFADDTVKVMYDKDGVIRSVVNTPIPERGDIYAVSMFWPVGMSVAEIAIDEYPTNCSIDGTWKFDGKCIYQDTAIVDANTLAVNTALRDKYALNATLAISAIQCSAEVGNPRINDADNLLSLQQYLDQLRDADLTVAPDAPPITLSNL
ncbi:tail fiber assembly protein [Salmonella enterica]|nr:tail fiber assembly protein [Salmonella enterica]